MRFPRYAKYKGSGVEWLGEVPEHWGIEPLYSLGKEREESNAGLVNENLLSLSYGRIIKKDIDTSDGLLPESFETYQIVHPGDIIFRLTDLQNDKRSLRTAIASESGIITFAYTAFEPRAVLPAYLNYLLRDYDLRKIFYSMGGGVRQSMKFDDIKRLPTLVPSIDEQVALVSFLDDETLKIDELIEQQRRLIELLKEKHQAVISHALTKGYNVDAQMKDSGIEWLRFVPTHWRLLRASYVSTIFVPQRNKPELNSDGEGLPWITMDQMREEEITGSDNWVSAEAAIDAGSRTIRKGAVIASCVGNFGVASVNQCDVIINQQLQAFIPNSEINAKFLQYYVGFAKAYFELIGTAATIPYVNQQGFASLPIALPPIAEQELVVSRLADITSRISGLLVRANDAIALLQERRSALISAAVTGKIDVRNYKSKEAA